VSTLEQDSELSIVTAPETPARMAATYSIFADGGAYHPMAEVLSVTRSGNRVWTYNPTSTQVLASAEAAISDSFLRAGPSLNTSADTAADTNAAVGVTSTIGGDVTAWYSGYDANAITSVAVWDEVQERVSSKTYVVQHSLGGLGGLSADSSVQWPTDVWSTYTTAVTSGRPLILKPGHGRTFATVPAFSILSAGR
jgi:membrane peptidoglycan carboxypeptidase